MEINDRVALISKLNDKKHFCYFIGYGVYRGRSIVKLNSKLDKIGRSIAKKLIPCYMFITDDNRIFYNYECWHMPEEIFKKVFINDLYHENWKIIKSRKKSKHILENA